MDFGREEERPRQRDSRELESARKIAREREAGKKGVKETTGECVCIYICELSLIHI